MDDIPIWLLSSLLVVLLCISAFFSGSETGLMTLNPYRLRHLRSRLRSADRTSKLLERPDRLIGLILIGNNLTNNFTVVITTLLAIRVFGPGSETVAVIILTLVILIFAEITPKTVAAVHPERVAFPASFILYPLLKVVYPLVWAVNHVSNLVVRLLGVDPSKKRDHRLSREELRAVVNESRDSIHQKGLGMLINVLDLDQVTVNDIMVPRTEITGLNLEDDIEQLVDQITTTEFTRLPVFKGDINNIVGILHMRRVSRLLKGGAEGLTKEAIQRFSKDPYFVPESTPLPQQLVNFQQNKRRIGLVVDEYGEIQGLVTLEDILEEIVGDFTTNFAESDEEIVEDRDGSYLIDGTATVREVNKVTGWALPTDGPKTLNGLTLEILESIPTGNVCFQVDGYRIETRKLSEKMVEKARVWRA